MKNNKHIIETYNNADTIAVISLYPKKGETYSKGTTGVASYTKNVVTEWSRNAVVFTNTITQPESYEEHNTYVIRCFTPNTITLWFQILKELRKFNRIKKVLIQLDFSMYGNIISTGLVLSFIGLLRVLGYEPHIVLHHVITNVNHLSGHVGLSNSVTDQIKKHIYNVMFTTFNMMLGLVSSNIIILEETLKQKLSHTISSSKITVIPHAVDTSLEPMDKAKARKKLKFPQDEFVVMFFGYVNWFKGADLFVEYFKQTQSLAGKKVRFIIAGGESPTMKSKQFYQTYFSDVKQAVEESHNVSMTGYVAQDDICSYFSAADLVVFPYREYMCASGVLSLVFSYKKPFIVSDQLVTMFESKDMEHAMNTVGLSQHDLTFALNASSVQTVSQKVLENGLKAKMVTLANELRTMRSFERNATIYESVLFEQVPDTQVSGIPALALSDET